MTDTEIAGIVAKLTGAEKRFLRRVCDGLPIGHADRPEDRARQTCRRRGLVHVVRNPRRWEALPLGLAVRAALQEAGE